jgi:hypothetical protein
MPTVITQGAASAKGYGFGASSAPPVYIEDVFSTYLYTGTGASQTITNGVDLSTKGGMVWIKSRSAATNNFLFDTARGTTKEINSNTTDAEATLANSLTAFNADGFTVNSATGIGVNAATYASWTFREQAKFFDVVTYTGNGANRTIAHNLGSVPGCIIVKCTSDLTDWAVYHRSLTSATNALQLNTTGAQLSNAAYWNSTAPTSTVFSVGTDNDTNGNLRTYVAYLFAHDAGGFGLNGTDNVISCGSFTGPSATVNLGWEPQFVLTKAASGPNSVDNWMIGDTMRGLTQSNISRLFPNLTNAENDVTFYVTTPTSTGFEAKSFANGATYIYIAIRRGPMKTPTTGTSVFGLSARTGTGADATVTGGQTDDAVLIKNRGRVEGDLFAARLTSTGYLETSSTAAEVAAGTITLQANPWDVMDGVKVGTTAYKTNATADTFINYLFRRAPGFFDVVCYTATGVARTINHNLGIAPELMIVKNRSAGRPWAVYSASLLNTEFLDLSTTAAKSNVSGSTYWNSTNPTASVFSVGTNAAVNDSISSNYVAYLFATVAGVSKVGSYTGTAALQTINCGFTGGARFVLIKRTDSTGDWYVWDSARGISSGNDPYLLLNSTAAEVTGTNYVDTTSTGFQVTAAAPAGINANGGTYIFLAIA